MCGYDSAVRLCSSCDCDWFASRAAAPPPHQVPVPWHWLLSPVSKVLPSLEGQLVPGKYLRFPHSVPHCPHWAAPRCCGHQQQNASALQSLALRGCRKSAAVGATANMHRADRNAIAVSLCSAGRCVSQSRLSQNAYAWVMLMIMTIMTMMTIMPMTQKPGTVAG